MISCFVPRCRPQCFGFFYKSKVFNNYLSILFYISFWLTNQIYQERRTERAFWQLIKRTRFYLKTRLQCSGCRSIKQKSKKSMRNEKAWRTRWNSSRGFAPKCRGQAILQGKRKRNRQYLKAVVEGVRILEAIISHACGIAKI